MKCIRRQTLEKYERLIAGRKRWAKQEINGLRKAIGYSRWSEGEDRDNRLRLLEKMSEALTENKSWPITAEQTEQGIEYLRRLLLKTNGERTRNKVAQKFTDEQVDIVRKFKRFTFVGLHEVYSDYDGRLQDTLPIYRVHSRDGKHFDYAPIHWGEPLVETVWGHLA
jgi:hypothetical protein